SAPSSPTTAPSPSSPTTAATPAAGSRPAPCRRPPRAASACRTAPSSASAPAPPAGSTSSSRPRTSAAASKSSSLHRPSAPLLGARASLPAPPAKILAERGAASFSLEGGKKDGTAPGRPGRRAVGKHNGGPRAPAATAPPAPTNPETTTMILAAIIGYGNLGRSVARVIADQPDMELVGVFSRRDSLDTDARVLPAADVAAHKDEVDVLFVCLGSATD